jgi:hypothetical protein
VPWILALAGLVDYHSKELAFGNWIRSLWICGKFQHIPRGIGSLLLAEIGPDIARFQS